MNYKNVLYEGIGNERQKNVLNHYYSPREIENKNVEILHNVSTNQSRRSTTNQYVSIKDTLNMV